MSWISKISHRSKQITQPPQGGETGDNIGDNSSRKPKTPGDNPIRRFEDDTLGRGGNARSFAQQVLAVDAKEGFVVGVLGAWGSGKTSFINLARDEFTKAGVTVLDFNPWMFSGAQQLVESFFVELSAQLKIRPGLAEIGKNLEDYGESFSGLGWLPVVGTWIERVRGVTKILSKGLQRRKEGIGERRQKLEQGLSKLGMPIIVVLDDIDRLSTSEIQDVFKLVRLTASFPNIIYVVAFDRGRIEKALTDEGVPGRDYLEKILQLAVDLPAIPSEMLNRQIFSAIDGALASVDKPGSFDEQVWPDIFMEVVRPLIKNMRDVRRYAAAVNGTVAALDGQIALADALALEAVRLFLPDVFRGLHDSVEGLTTTSGDSEWRRDDPPRLKEQTEKLVKDGGSHSKIVRDMITRLFPAGGRHVGSTYIYGYESERRWLEKRRVAHKDILQLYLERIAGQGLQAFKSAEQAWSRMSDRDAFEKYLRSLDPGSLRDVIENLEIYEDRFESDHVVPGITVLLNILPDIPERKRGMSEFPTAWVANRVVYRLLRTLGTPEAVEAAVRRIIPELQTLSAQLQVIGDIGHREGRGHKMVSETAAVEFEKAWRQAVRMTSARNLAKEPNLLWVLIVAKQEADETEPAINIGGDPHLTLAILQSALGEVLSQGMGTRAIQRAPRLDWAGLMAVYGNEETLRNQIEELKKSGIAPEDLLSLADKYFSGWRHDGDPRKYFDRNNIKTVRGD